MSLPPALALAVQLGAIRALDYHFARLIDELAQGAEPSVALAAALLSQRMGEGDVCLDLAEWAGRPPFDALPSLAAPDLETWRSALRRCPVVSRSADAPLVLDGDALYLARYWRFEAEVAEALRRRAQAPPQAVDEPRLAADLARLLGAGETAADQRRAAELAVRRRLAIISGGPGTGKTRTVAAILALLLAQQPALRIGLAAPTGKAAARLGESIREVKQALDLEPGLRGAIPENAVTLHRLIGVMPGRSQPRYHAGRPMPLDLLVIDEASMVDLPLLARTLAALPESARLVLLGDRDQLASVESGAVLADICDGATTRTDNALAGAIALLEHSYRFARDSGIGALARAIRSGRGEAVAEVLVGGYPDLVLESPAALDSRLGPRLERWLRAVRDAPGPAEALAALDRFRILCAVREGPHGVQAVNARIEAYLRRHLGVDTRSPWYPGRPVMVQGNDYALGLFNGDIGIVWPDENGRRKVCFPGEGGLRCIPAQRMPAHETVYAMTVHKSQGSEFDEVLLLLPEREVRVLSRELVYTAVTRARRRLELWAEPAILAAAARQRVYRRSGLRRRLWSGAQ